MRFPGEDFFKMRNHWEINLVISHTYQFLVPWPVLVLEIQPWERLVLSCCTIYLSDLSLLPYYQIYLLSTENRRAQTVFEILKSRCQEKNNNVARVDFSGQQSNSRGQLKKIKILWTSKVTIWKEGKTTIHQ